MKKIISIILPLYNEEKNVYPIVRAVSNAVPLKYQLEIILIDDGSQDNTRQKIANLASKNKQIKGIFFYRNFGHQPALLAGIKNAQGEAVVTLDADFQHPPNLISKMIKLWEEGNDLVVGQRQVTDIKGLKLLFLPLRIFGYWTYSLLTDKILYPGVSEFRLMDKIIVNYLCECNEHRTVIRGLVMLPARNIAFLPYKLNLRMSGKTKYTFKKLLKLYIFCLTSFSLAPLRLTFLLSELIMFGTFFYIAYILIMTTFFHKPIVENWKTTTILISLLFGSLFFYLGILGEYIGALFDEIKNRPKYIIEKTINISQKI